MILTDTNGGYLDQLAVWRTLSGHFVFNFFFHVQVTLFTLYLHSIMIL